MVEPALTLREMLRVKSAIFPDGAATSCSEQVKHFHKGIVRGHSNFFSHEDKLL
jgi:hypothetical protein